MEAGVRPAVTGPGKEGFMTDEQFHKERQTGIGGSDAAVVVLGENYGKTTYDLWLEKTGQITPTDESNPDMRRGKRQEPIAAQLYEEQTGQKLRRVNTLLRHKDYPFMIAHIDREILGKDAVLEIKCPRMPTFRKYKLGGIPEDIQIQGQHYLAVKRKGLIVFAIFCAEVDELMVVPIEKDNELIEYITGKEQNFWNYVTTSSPPPLSIPEKLDLPPVGGELIRIETPQWLEASRALKDARDLKAEAEDLENQAKAQVQDLMIKHNADVAEGFGLRAYWREQAGRISLDTKRLKKEIPEIWERYSKQGDPFKSFRPYFITDGRNES
jgi:putative phage-type endonuclease